MDKPRAQRGRVPQWVWWLAGLMALALITRGGVFSLIPGLLRYGLPVLAIYIAYRGVRSLLAGRGQANKLDREDVIDLCPRCGETLSANHRC